MKIKIILTSIIYLTFIVKIFTQNSIIYSNGSLFGLKTSAGEILLKPIYKSIEEFDKYGYAIAESNRTSYFIINVKGEIVEGPYLKIKRNKYYENIYTLEDYRNEIIFNIFSKKKFITEVLRFDSIYFNGKYYKNADFENGYKKVESNFIENYIDTSFNLVFNEALRFTILLENKNFVAKNNNGKYGVYDSNKKNIVPFDYDDLIYLHDEQKYILTKDFKLYKCYKHYFDIKKKKILDTIEYCTIRKEGNYFIAKDFGNKLFILDSKFEKVLQNNFDGYNIAHGKNKDYFICSSGGYGYLKSLYDKNERKILEAESIEVKYYYNEKNKKSMYLMVEYKNEYQVLNEDLEILFKQNKDSYTNKSFEAFYNSTPFISLCEQYYSKNDDCRNPIIVNLKGDVISNEIYYKVEFLENCNFYIVKQKYIDGKGGKHGVVGYDGEIIIPFEYNSIYYNYDKNYTNEKHAFWVYNRLLNKYEIIDLTNNPIQKINYYPTPVKNENPFNISNSSIYKEDNDSAIVVTEESPDEGSPSNSKEFYSFIIISSDGKSHKRKN